MVNIILAKHHHVSIVLTDVEGIGLQRGHNILCCIIWTSFICCCECLCNPFPCLNSLSSHQTQQVSTQPSTDNGLCPTGRPSSRSWLAWLTRTHLAPRPWPRGKRPVWISSNSCWLGPTQIWVRDAHPKVSASLSACATMCALAQSTRLAVAQSRSAFLCFCLVLPVFFFFFLFS